MKDSTKNYIDKRMEESRKKNAISRIMKDRKISQNLNCVPTLGLLREKTAEQLETLIKLSSEIEAKQKEAFEIIFHHPSVK